MTKRLGVKLWRLKNLLAYIRRCVENRPVVPVEADGKRGLGLWREAGRRVAGGGAIGTIAVPLRQTAASGCAEHEKPDAGHDLVLWQLEQDGFVAIRLCIAIDFHSAGNFNELRCSPFHCLGPFSSCDRSIRKRNTPQSSLFQAR
jgi:hypothetical protein